MYGAAAYLLDFLHNRNFYSYVGCKQPTIGATPFAQDAFFVKMLDSLTALPVASQKL